MSHNLWLGLIYSNTSTYISVLMNSYCFHMLILFSILFNNFFFTLPNKFFSFFSFSSYYYFFFFKGFGLVESILFHTRILKAHFLWLLRILGNYTYLLASSSSFILPSISSSLGNGGTYWRYKILKTQDTPMNSFCSILNVWYIIHRVIIIKESADS